MKVQELIEEKYKNFIKFIQNKYPENNEIEKMKNINVKLVIEYLKNSIYPYRHDPEMLMFNISDEYKINLNEFSNDEKTKLKKYLNFFIEQIEEIYYN
eukprot:gene9816-2140_t